MARLVIDSDRYGDAPVSVLVEAVHNAVRDMIRRKLDDSGAAWPEFVFGTSNAAITTADFTAVEQRILDSGYRFAWSALISARERPEAYQPAEGFDSDAATFSFEHADAPTSPLGDDGREQRGAGDNVVRRDRNVIGTARYIRSSDAVLAYMQDGVPDDMIAIIDDSGGTLTAPILEQFKGVICAGGTVRSHLGILTREYGIPCLMNARISGIREGDLVELETSAAAKTADAYQRGEEMIARVWKVAR